MNINTVIHGDSVTELKNFPVNSVDLIFADPPYNLQLKHELRRPNQTKVAAVNDAWDKFSSFAEYDEFSRAWLQECRRVLKPSGSIWVIGSYHNIFRIGSIMQDIGFWIYNDVLWIKTNPMPNFKGTRFNNAHETLIWAGKSEKSKPTFNYKSLKAFNDDKQMRSDWFIPICSGNERVKLNGKKAHSTQKPEALLYRVILSTSKEGDLVLDPFLGSGTTATVAKKLGRSYVGIEKDEKYIMVSKKRIEAVNKLDENLNNMDIELKQPRVPFGSLIETEYIKPGEYLYDKKGKSKALVLVNSSIKFGNKVGSIHKISAIIENAPSYNGWEYWYVKRKNELVPISELRQAYLYDIGIPRV